MWLRQCGQLHSGEGPNVAWVTNLLAYYRLPCFRELCEKMSGRLTFFLMDDGKKKRSYITATEENGLPTVHLRGWQWSRPKSLFLHCYDDLHLNDLRPIVHGQYDTLVLSGWDEPTYLLLWAWGVASQKRIIFWCESTTHDLLRGPIRETYKRFLLRHADGCIVAGKRSYEYCEQLGMAGSRVFNAPNTTDCKYFQLKAMELLAKREALRNAAGLRGLVILFVGRLEESQKGVSTLIQSCAALERESISISLVCAGDGQDKEFYENLVRREGLRCIRFPGMLGRDELCQYYAMSDVLVLPSRSEPWGFTVNEAMEFGLPVIVSEAVGAGPDLVHSGENGFVFPVGDCGELADSLRMIAANESLRKRMGQASKEIIQNFTPEAWAKGVLKAIEVVTGKAV
jgi:glycosyltransferase involved in cell wall biosynthesis